MKDKLIPPTSSLSTSILLEQKSSPTMPSSFLGLRVWPIPRDKGGPCYFKMYEFQFPLFLTEYCLHVIAGFYCFPSTFSILNTSLLVSIVFLLCFLYFLGFIISFCKLDNLRILHFLNQYPIVQHQITLKTFACLGLSTNLTFNCQRGEFIVENNVCSSIS